MGYTISPGKVAQAFGLMALNEFSPSRRGKFVSGANRESSKDRIEAKCQQKV